MRCDFPILVPFSLPFGHPRWETCNKELSKLDRHWTVSVSVPIDHTMSHHVFLLLSCLVIEVRWAIRDFGPNRQFPMTWRLMSTDGRHWMYFMFLFFLMGHQNVNMRLLQSSPVNPWTNRQSSVEVVGAYFGDTARRRALQGCGTLEWRLTWLAGSAWLQGFDLNISIYIYTHLIATDLNFNRISPQPSDSH